MAKVLVTDKLGESGLALLRERPDIELVISTGLDEDGVCAAIADADALIIRSGTTVTEKVLDAAKKLRVIGRAGIGVDNIDVPAATDRGVLVLNTPDANATTTAELAIAHLFSLSRRLPQAHASLKDGKWERSAFMGTEVTDKTVGIVGFGTIGRIFADRCLGLKMRVLAFDPFVTPEAMKAVGVEHAELERLLAESDYVSIHCPKVPATAGLINAERIAMMKKGARLINCARGGIVDEGALLAALENGHLAGAALDVYETEPPSDHPLLHRDDVVGTPHLGASSTEAQTKVATAIASQVADFLETGEVRNAINLPPVAPEEAARLAPWLRLAGSLGTMLSQLAPEAYDEVELGLYGAATEVPAAPLCTAALIGILSPRVEAEVNAVNAPGLAKLQGMNIVTKSSTETVDYTSLLRLTVRHGDKKTELAGTLLGGRRPRLTRIDEFAIEVVPGGVLLVTRHVDKPGVIGAMCTYLGEEEINISRMQLGLASGLDTALAVLCISRELTQDQLKDICGLDAIVEVRQILG